MYRLRARRTTGSNPPNDLLYGELAYSNANKRLYLGRPDGPPAAFESDLSLSPITEAISTLTTDLATLNDSQAAQDTVIAALNATTDSQADTIGAISASTSTLNGALVSLAADVQAALATKANQSSLAPVANTGAYADLSGKPTLFSGAYGDLTGLPTLFSGAYADLSGKPTLFSGAYGDLTGLPTLFSGAYADLSGKPALFSGAYGDLTGRPTIPYGFTYDQVTEPTSPPIGSTWRERAANGSIIADWEWSGSLWLGQRQRSESVGVNISGSGGLTYTPQFVPFAASSQVFIEAIRVSFLQSSGTINASNAWLVWARCYRDDAITTITYTTQVMTTGTFDLNFPINSVLPSGTNSAFVGATMSISTGTPGPGKLRVAVTRRLVRV